MDSRKISLRVHQGFSSSELLIVVAILLILATISIPVFLRSHQTSNEVAAVSTLRLLNAAEVSYSEVNKGCYGSMSELIGAGRMEARFGAEVSGYDFTVALSPDRLAYTAYATAASGNTGRYDYYTSPDYIIRYSTASSRSPVALSGQPVRKKN